MTGPDGNTSQTVATYESVPGTFNVRCTITYPAYGDSGGHNYPLQTDVPQTTITVPGPDGQVITSVLNIDTPYNVGSQSNSNGDWLVFQLTCGGSSCGPYTDLTVTELISDVVSFGSDEAGGTGQQGANLYAAIGKIFDYKKVNCSNALWENYNVGDTIITYTQVNTL